MNNEQWTVNREPWTVKIPIQTIKPSTYFLSFSRLSLPKRVGLIVDAFLEMPEQNLILTYGKNDPLKREILQQIEGKSNILALESPSDDELIVLIQWAIASISLPIDEDFGMSPVESMACGTPVIGANEWGLRETIFDGRTGKLIDIMDHLSWIKVLKETVQGIDRDAWKHMRHDCRLRADDFSLEKFEKKLQFHLDKR